MSDWISGVVKTNKVGSECVFDICRKEDWDVMTEDEQQEELQRAMWDSGLVEVYVKEQA